VRVILEERVELGEEYTITIGEEEKSPLNRRPARALAQYERDGFVVGLEFQFVSGEHPALLIPPPDGPGEDDGSGI